MGQRKDFFLGDNTIYPSGGTCCIEGYGGFYPYGWDDEPVASPIDTAT